MDLRSLQDWLVGGVSMAIGAAFCYGALVESRLQGRLKLARLITEKLGPTAARVIGVLFGLLLIVLGIAIACGYSIELIGRHPRRAAHGHFHA